MPEGADRVVCRDWHDVGRLIARHHRLRARGQPVLTTIAGPLEANLAGLTEIDRRLGRDVVCFDDRGGPDAWIQAVGTSSAVHAALHARLAAARGGGAPGQRWRPGWRPWSLLVPDDPDEAKAVETLAEAIVTYDADGLARLFHATGRDQPRGELAASALARLLRLVGPEALPIIRVAVGVHVGLGAIIDAQLALAATPPVAAEIVVDAGAIDAWQARSPSNARARVRDGLIGAPAGLPDPTGATRGVARSLPEQLLYEALEADARLTGMFRLNTTVDISFGGRPMEIDLLCASHRVAVEVDGWHHFQTAERYRKDRAKDLDLQHHGYVVLRVLVGDVTARPDEVLARIREAVAHRPETGRRHG